MAKNKHIAIGQLGENIACKYLKNRGFVEIDRNYRKKWGELDLVCKKDNVLHFVEVKSSEVFSGFPKDGEEAYRPEDHVAAHKKMRMQRIIQTYLGSVGLHGADDWSVMVVVVLINASGKRVRVRVYKDVVLD